MDRNPWRERSFDGLGQNESPPGLTNRVLLRSVGVATVVASVVVWLVSRGRSVFRCRQECYGAPPLDQYGSLTYEPGHPWTYYADSWQWSAQHGLTQLAVVASLVGLGLALWSRRSPLPAFGLTVVALAAWGLWAALSPPIP